MSKLVRTLRGAAIAAKTVARPVSFQRGYCSRSVTSTCPPGALVSPFRQCVRRSMSAESKTAAPGPSASSDGGSSNSRGPMSWATLVLLVGGGAVLVVYFNVKRHQKKVEAASKVETFGRPAIGGPWSLVDAAGRPMTSGDLTGQYYLVYFGFTFCPDICPNELVKMGRVVDGLEKRSGVPSVEPIFITLDPYRDSCAQVGAYVKDFHPRMVGLTGTPGQVAKVAKAFRVYFAEVDRKEDDEDYLVDHSIALYLMGPDGEFVDLYTQMMTAPEIVEKIASTIGSKSTIDGNGILGWLGFGKR